MVLFIILLANLSSIFAQSGAKEPPEPPSEPITAGQNVAKSKIDIHKDGETNEQTEPRNYFKFDIGFAWQFWKIRFKLSSKGGCA